MRRLLCRRFFCSCSSQDPCVSTPSDHRGDATLNTSIFDLVLDLEFSGNSYSAAVTNFAKPWRDSSVSGLSFASHPFISHRLFFTVSGTSSSPLRSALLMPSSTLVCDSSRFQVAVLVALSSAVVCKHDTPRAPRISGALHSHGHMATDTFGFMAQGQAPLGFSVQKQCAVMMQSYLQRIASISHNQLAFTQQEHEPHLQQHELFVKQTCALR